MTIDLKWFLPFVLPLAFLATMRAIVWIAGLAWEGEIVPASIMLSGMIGFLIGGMAVIFLALEGLGINLHIWRGRA